MFAVLKRHFRRRKLAFVVVAVPRALKTGYGAQPSYTAPQVRRTIEDLRIRRDLSAYAFAACCSEEEFSKALPDRAPGDYLRLRNELVDTFEIGTADFTCDNLRSLKYVPRSNRWATLGDGQQGTLGGGVHYNETMMQKDC
jgi:hypothetical protein